MITKTVEIKLSGKDLADELWELDCQEQADFFNKNGFVSLQKKKKRDDCADSVRRKEV